MRFSFFSLFTLFYISNAYCASGFTWADALINKFHLPIKWNVLTFLFVVLIITLIGLLYRKKASSSTNVIIPDRGLSLRNLVEAYGQFIYGECKKVLGEKEAPKYFCFVAMLFITIFLSNVIGLIPGFLPPTEKVSTTLAFGTFAFIYFNLKGCKELGTINYLKHFAGPLWYLGPLIFAIEMLSNFIRPVSLALRLGGNMMGDHIVLGTFSNLVPLLVPLPFYLLGLLVCLIQAYVFTMLTIVYINLATAHHDHDEHAHH